MTNTLLNLLWILLGGFVISLIYVAASLLLMITLIGIPFGLQTLKLGILALCPFGRQVLTSPSSSGCLSILINILWILCGGIWIAIAHLVFGIICCVTLIGIPLGMQHFKMASLALTPFGKEII